MPLNTASFSMKTDLYPGVVEHIFNSSALRQRQMDLCELKVRSWAGEMAQWLRALPALPEVLSSIPSDHMVAHNHL